MIIISKAQARALGKLSDHTEPASAYRLRERLPTLNSLCNMGFARIAERLPTDTWPRINILYEITEEGRAAYPHVDYVL